MYMYVSCPKCQIGVLPLGTGNDLSRVLGWGTSFDDDNAVTQFLQHLERAKAAVLDRWVEKESHISYLGTGMEILF